jgi:hypothetical protein
MSDKRPVRRLRRSEPVSINLDGANERIDCYVKSVNGAIATLGRPAGLPPSLRQAMTPGLLGYLTFSSNGQAVALRGVATVDCAAYPDFAFVGLDGIKMPERRSDVRFPLATSARLCTVDDEGFAIGQPIETVTADLSLGGVLIERRQRMGIGPVVQIEMDFDSLPMPLRCMAVVARLTVTHMGVRFTEMTEVDRVRLTSILDGLERRAAA